MKRIIFTAIALLFVTGVFAQSEPADTTKKSADTSNSDKPKILISYGNHHSPDDTVYHSSGKHYPKGYIGITFSRFDIVWPTSWR